MNDLQLIYLSFFPELTVKIYDILNNVKLLSSLRSNKAIFFQRRSCFVAFGPNEIFRVLWKIDAWIFFCFFCTKLQQHKILKLPKWIFGRKILFGGFLAKTDKNRPKMRFSKFYEKSIPQNFSDLQKVTLV